MTAITIEPIKPHIGSLVRVDKARLCDPEIVQTVREAMEQRGVLVFPELHLTDAEQLAFTDAFGQRLNYTSGATPNGARGAVAGEEADVYKIALGKGATLAPEFVYATWFWHTDGVTVDQPLPKATMLSARKLSLTGGQTEFANTFAAWARLPAAEQAAIAELRVIHRLEAAMRHVFREIPEDRLARFRQAPEMVVPLVWTQQDGRQSLVLGTHADEVIGMPYTAGRSLLERLIEWAAQPDFSYSHDWREGDFVIWNNHGVMHRVVPYDADSDRNMHRTSIQGDQRLGRPLAELQPA
ncbi:TauD/TfdA family dioxygenase [Novosphingobium sp. G106]|uniref:TauD/TfdA dioxygenase family protein n=1 Tax=Novosphingobium sp. G106 TaxID=2849500 RepID=UPI001C2DE677|nr:TauD/TfdA family dioxygenase [Novosphingobium sp. G106]MBV1688629.1 TauD/TfdA family dioxygenase [Novosphingobium sp. G106]